MDASELLANCEKEQLHLTGHIQPFCGLILVDEESQDITHVSGNIESLTGLPAEQLLGESLATLSWLSEEDVQQLAHEPGARQYCFYRKVNNQEVHLRLLRSEQAIVIELEPVRSRDAMNYHWLESQLYPPAQTSWTETQYYDALLETLHEALPFGRLMLYQFDSDWVGEVVAELSEQQTAYLGLKFPASDIPAIARKMYFQNPSRLIADISAEPVPVISVNNSTPDLTWSDSRSVSPVHIQYLSNMNVQSSYSIPVIISGKLWGIVACHDAATTLLDAQHRHIAERLVKHFSTVFNGYRSKQRLSMLSRIETKVNEMTAELSRLEADQSCQYLAESLLDHMQGSTAAIYLNDQWFQAGQPVNTSLLNALDKKVQRDFTDFIFSTHNIIDKYGDHFDDPAIRGIMAIKPNFESYTLRCYVFRVPQAQYTHWAGNPDKSLQQASDDGVLSPRSSFKSWTEVRGEASRYWSRENELLAKKVRAVILRQADKLLLS